MKRNATGRSQVLRDASIWILIVAAGAAVRWSLRDLPNFAPVSAIALFSGYYFGNLALGLLAPICVMLLSDLFIGGYPYSWGSVLVLGSVYSMLAFPAVWRGPLRRWLPVDGRGWKGGAAALGLVGCALASSLVFFLVTNLAVWMAGDWYPRSLTGLAHCYWQALPFFRNTLAGDLSFACLLFGGYTALSAPQRHMVWAVRRARR